MRRATAAEADALCPWLPDARAAWMPRGECARPLVVRARLRSPVVRLRRGEHALDALLGYAVVARATGAPPGDAMAHVPRDLHVDIPVPIADDPETGVARCAWPRLLGPAREAVAMHVRKPDAEALGARKVFVAGGSAKPTRDAVPLVSAWALEWDVVGDADRIRDLLTGCHALGGRRAAGYGAVAAWEVRDADEDTALVRDGSPARPLPLRGDEDQRFPGGWTLAEMATRAPYWHRATRQLCAVPP